MERGCQQNANGLADGCGDRDGGRDGEDNRAGCRGRASARAGDLVVGETVILTTPPCLSILKHLIKVQGGCHQMTELSPTARSMVTMWTMSRAPLIWGGNPQ